MGSSRVPVDANILSLDEYEQCLDALQRDRELNTFDVNLARVAALIFIIGFRCGTRRSEVLKLRLADYHPSSRSELLIRAWSNRRLKTKCSTRKLPIHVLLTKHELQMLDDWYNKRCLEERGGSTDSYLFTLPEKMLDSIPEEFVFSKIHRVLRTETGDQQLRYHHLHRSLATWTSLRVFLSDLESISELFPTQPKLRRGLISQSSFVPSYI